MVEINRYLEAEMDFIEEKLVVSSLFVSGIIKKKTEWITQE